MNPTNSVNHYENFPVASVLIPAQLRPAIASVYWFARSADDIADEGKAMPSARLASLGVYRQQIEAIAQGKASSHPQFQTLAAHMNEHALPPQLFLDLITAFEQDCKKKRYANWEELRFYCQHSANPVGRIMLKLFGYLNDETAKGSDQICTGLQLVNFLQDIRHDWAVDRLYVPVSELAAQGLTEYDIDAAAKTRIVPAALESVLELQHQRAAMLLEQGGTLLPQLKGRFGLEIAATVAGGQQMLRKMAKQQFSGFAGRPKIGKSDWIIIMARALRSRWKA